MIPLKKNCIIIIKGGRGRDSLRLRNRCDELKYSKGDLLFPTHLYYIVISLI